MAEFFTESMKMYNNNPQVKNQKTLKDFFNEGLLATNKIGIEHKKKMGYFKKLFHSGPHNIEYDYSLLRFICPHCFKAIFYTEIDLECPICSKVFLGNSRYQLETTDENNMTFTVRLPETIKLVFYKCDKCGKSISDMSCPHCEQEIDLSLPYDEKALENQRD